MSLDSYTVNGKMFHGGEEGSVGGSLASPVFRDSPDSESEDFSIKISGSLTDTFDVPGSGRTSFSIPVAGRDNPLQDAAVWGTQAVPEPLTILGSATALGVGALLKRESSKKKNKS